MVGLGVLWLVLSAVSLWPRRDVAPYGGGVNGSGRRSAAAPVRVLMAVLGAAVLLAGIAFHAAAAYYRPGGEQPLHADLDLAFLSWGWLRLAAWVAIAGGAWLLAAARGRGSASGAQVHA